MKSSGDVCGCSALSRCLVLMLLVLLATGCGSDRGSNLSDVSYQDIQESSDVEESSDIQEPWDTDASSDVDESSDTEETSDIDEPSDVKDPVDAESSEKISLKVLRGWESPKFGEETAPNGARFIYLDVELSNEAGNSPLSASYERFDLELGNGLLLGASGFSALTDAPCSTQIRILGGKSHRCELIFEAQVGQVAKTLHYNAVTPDMRKAEAAATVTPCNQCGGVCVDLKTDDDHCGQCNNKCTTSCSNGACKPFVLEYTYVGTGKFHTCALLSDKTVRCWGSNYNKQAVSPPGKFIQLSVGYHHNCAVREDNSAYCWGLNTYGRATPPAGKWFTKVFAQFDYSCGIDTSNKAVCWGNNSDKQVTGIPATDRFIDLALESTVPCGLRTDNTVRCWGTKMGTISKPSGTFTELEVGFAYWGLRSDGTVVDWGAANLEDFRVDVPTEKFSSIAGGYQEFSCGILKSNGYGRCWIDGYYNGTNVIPTLPQVALDQISVGELHVCYIRKDNKQLVCVGENRDGQLNVPAL